MNLAASIFLKIPRYSSWAHARAPTPAFRMPVPQNPAFKLEIIKFNSLLKFAQQFS